MNDWKVFDELLRAHVREFGPDDDGDDDHKTRLDLALIAAAKALGYESLRHVWEKDYGKPWAELEE